ncbi:MAG: hypothetical protein DYG89_43620 [Caldilinea sp. CFX5]|nr:hypothetical protein [Caldilinea sp. CFX5]
MPILETMVVLTGFNVTKRVIDKAMTYFFPDKAQGAKNKQLPVPRLGLPEQRYLAQQAQREEAWLLLQKEAAALHKVEAEATIRIAAAEAKRAEYALQLTAENLAVRRQELVLMQERLRHEQMMGDAQRQALAVMLQLRTKELQLIEQGLAAKQVLGHQYLEVLRQQTAQTIEYKQQELQAYWDEHKWAGILSRHEMQQILSSHSQHHRLLVIVSPPVISCAAPTTFIENLPLELPSELKAFLEEQYPANDPLCPVQFFGKFFDRPIFDTEVKKLETLLAPLPTAILYSNITDDKVFIHFSFSSKGEVLTETLSWHWQEEQAQLIQAGVPVEAALRQVRRTIVEMHQFLAAFLTDLYYLSVNPLHEPHIYCLEGAAMMEWQTEIFAQIRVVQMARQQCFQQTGGERAAEQTVPQEDVDIGLGSADYTPQVGRTMDPSSNAPGPATKRQPPPPPRYQIYDDPIAIFLGRKQQ